MSVYDPTFAKPSEAPAGYPPPSPSFAGSVYQGSSVIPPPVYDVQDQPGFYVGHAIQPVPPRSGVIRTWGVDVEDKESATLVRIVGCIGVACIIFLFVDLVVGFVANYIYIGIVDIILVLTLPVCAIFGARRAVLASFSVFILGIIILTVWKFITFVIICIDITKLRNDTEYRNLRGEARKNRYAQLVILVTVALCLLILAPVWLWFSLKLFRKIHYPGVRRRRDVGPGIETGGLPPPAFTREPPEAAAVATGSYAYSGGDAVVLGKTVTN